MHKKAEISKHSPTICTHFKFILQSKSTSDKVKSERKTGGKHMNTIGFNTNCSNAEEENILQKGEQNASCGKAINNVVTVRFDNSTLMKVTEFLLTVNTTEAAELLPKL